MSESQLIELVFLAALAGYLIYRLYLVLGQSGDEPMKKSEKSKVVPLHPSSKIREEIKVKTNIPPNPMLEELIRVNPHFDETKFKQGVEGAFVLIVETLAKGNIAKLKPYISKALQDKFTHITDSRKAKGETRETYVVAVNSIQILDVSIMKEIAYITVQIESDQATTIKDATGKDLYPDYEEIEHIIDQWKFMRPLDANEPVWVLQDIQDVSDIEAKG